jgi:hypothetical protein
MSLVGFKPTTAVFEREKTIRALDRAVAVLCKDSTYKGQHKQTNTEDRYYTARSQ